MSELAVHEGHCLGLFGNRFTEIHLFLDRNYDPREKPFESHKHRKFLHHFDGIAEVCRAFGMSALLPAVIHIMEDCLGYIPKKSDYPDGTVDMYGRPIDQSKIDTQWFERLKTFYRPQN